MTEDPRARVTERALFERLTTVHRKAGEPSSRELAVRIGGMSHSTVNDAIRGRRVPSWPILAKIVIALGGDEDEFRALWSETRSAGSTVASLPSPNSRTRPEVSVFVSYAHVDDRATRGRISTITDGIRDMYESLTGESVGIFLDKSSLAPGDDWKDRIRSGLSSSSVFLAFLSPAYLRSSMCNEEFWEFYRFLEVASSERLLVPLIFGDKHRMYSIADGADIWRVVDQLQYVDISDLRLASPDDRAWLEKTTIIAETIDSVMSEVRTQEASVTEEQILTNDDDLEPALLEQLLKLEEASPEFLRHSERISEILTAIGHQAGAASPLLVRAPTTKQKLAISRTLARSLHPHNDELSDEIDGLLRHLNVYDETVSHALTLISRDGRLAEHDDVQKTLEIIDETAGSGIETFAEVEVAREAIGSARGMSRDLDVELRQLQRTLLRLAGAKATFEKWRVGVSEYLD